MTYHKACRQCGDQFQTNKPEKTYCTRKCSQDWHRREYRLSHYTGLATGTVGAIGELRVAVDLLARGYEVLRALSPSCSCDLAILNNGNLYRVEVRTAYKNAVSGKKFKVLKANVGLHDIYAAMYKDEIEYLPSLP